MKNVFTWRYIYVLTFLSLVFVAIGCSDDDEPAPVITVADFEITLDENPATGTALGTLNVTTDKGTLAFSLQSESVSGAFAVDAATGALTVLDKTKFDYEVNKTLTAVVLVKNGNVESIVNVKVNLQKIIWTGANVTFEKAAGVDWTLAVNYDKITDKVIITRQNQGPIYNYQWWLDNFGGDATYADLYDDFWDSDGSEKEFTRQGGTQGVRWAILDDTGATTETWADFNLYGTLGDSTHFYSFHNIASIITSLEAGSNVVDIPDDFSITYEGGEVNEDAGTNMSLLVGKKLAIWLVDEDIYLTLTFTKWGKGGTDNSVAYTRSTKD